MTTHELYINDTLVDLDKDVNIYLLYQSMLFTDLQGIVSNRSYNVSLPKTAANLNAISHYNLADVSDETAEGSLTFPRKYHKVSYYRNGITIFEKGIGTFISIDSRINFAFSFGNAENFQKLFERNLNELPDNSYIAWNNNTPYVHLPNFENYGLLDIDFGQGSNKQYQHPTVASYYILDQIEKQSGITFEKAGNPPAYKYGFGSYLVPLATKNSNKQSMEAQKLNGKTVLYRFRLPNIIATEGALNPNINGLIDPIHLWNESTKSLSLRNHGIKKIRIIIEAFSTTWSANSLNDPNVSVYYWYRNGGYEPLANSRREFSNSKGYGYYDAVDKVIEVPDADVDSNGHGINYVNVYSILSGDTQIYFNGAAPKMQIIPIIEEIIFPSAFPIEINLPNIKQSDFLKGLMQLSGVFPYVKAENTIGFITVDDIIAKKNTSDTKDWTTKLINNPSTLNAPEGIEFKLENFTQRNLCKWDEGDDETLKGKYDGVMVVNNETIEKERECFKLPFAPTANVEYVNGEYKTKRAKIPVYTNDGGTVEYNDDITPRILNTKHVDGYSGASFEGMDLASVISTRYKSYQDIIRTPRVIKVKCLLNDYDLSTLDLTAPVYFEQFGNYYAILKVQAAADGVCKCEFLEI